MPIFVRLGALLAFSSAGFLASADASLHHRAAQGGSRSFPNLDIEAGCRDLSKSVLNKTTNYSGCVGEERDARTQLEKSWASFSAPLHEQCMHLVTPPALPSYVALQSCLNMAREAEKLPNDVRELAPKR